MLVTGWFENASQTLVHYFTVFTTSGTVIGGTGVLEVSRGKEFPET